MRLPLKGNDDFVSNINKEVDKIYYEFITFLKPKLIMQNVNVMLGDGTITSSETFDPREIRNLFQSFLKVLDGWIISDISESKTDDLHRLFFQISTTIDKFYIYGYFGIQFHALLFYNVDKRVIEIQKELIKLNQDQFESFSLLTEQGNETIKEELKKSGKDMLNFEELFTILFEDPQLMSRLEKIALLHEKEFPEIASLNRKRERLVLELNDMVRELYRISTNGIDYNRLMQGEEGIISYFEIEGISNKKSGIRDPYINTKIIKKATTESILEKLNEIVRILKLVSS
ncbi:MAG TPA: hypothetical protein VFP25_04275 [Nitrososphaeraceae archaeon]|nr:hypothetical protein [Nitrososphaeraceae archaeon]